MKLKTALSAALLAALPWTTTTAHADEVIRLSEPVEVTEHYEVFGSRISQLGEPMSLAAIIADAAAHTGKEVFVTARVAQVCQRKGCFFIAQDGDALARVTFKDYGFFIPTDSDGKQVTLVGTFTKKTISEAQARHYAEDAGKDPSKVVGDQSEYAIVATAVVIPKGRS